MQEMRTYLDPAAPPGTRCPRCDSDYVTPAVAGEHACKQCGARFPAKGTRFTKSEVAAGFDGNRHERRKAAALARKSR
jgi:ribosomal protein L37AE/L43A